MPRSNIGPAALVLAVCLGIGWPSARAAGVDARTLVDGKVKCVFPALLDRAVRQLARQEMVEGREAFDAMKQWAGQDHPPSYRWCAVDLNDDRRLEVIYHSGFCGMGGCSSHVLVWRGAKLIPIGEIRISHEGPMIGKRRHRGWRDLYIFQKGTASSFSIEVFTFRNDRYRRVAIPFLTSELSDRFVNPDGITIDRDRNAFHIGDNIPEEEWAERMRGHRGWHPSHWEDVDPGYRDEPYEKKN